MFTIKEIKAKRIPSITSLEFELNVYNKELFDLLVKIQGAIFDKKTNKFEFPLNKLYFLIDSLTRYDDVEFIAHNEKKRENISCRGIKFKCKPYQHQIEAIDFGLNHNKWMLLDDQGLGKTLSIIYLAEVLKKKENLKHCLIICGVNSLKYNWVDEIQKFSDLSCRILGQKISKTGKVSIGSVTERCKELKNGIKEFFVITNLETLQNKMFLDSFRKSKSTFDLIVVDEGHKVKNPSSMSAKTLMKLEANRKVVLSGTIIMNDPENAYVPLKWTENIGSNYTQFKSMFNVYGGFGGVQVIGHKNLDTLKELINSCSLRRLKDEVLDLQIKNYKTEYVELKPQQKKLYDEVKEGILAELDKLPSPPTIMQELTINMRLRQITATPTILSDTITQSAKLDRLEELVEEITSQGDKVVIMNTYKGAVEEESKRLKKYDPIICTGDQKDEEISKNKKIFETNSDRKVMICTWQKMGTGHTLTAANYLIFVDTPWTRADFDQTADRIYRIGQKKPVFIITMITKDTYDERVQQILDRKEQLSSFLLDDGKNTDMLNIIEE